MFLPRTIPAADAAVASLMRMLPLPLLPLLPLAQSRLLASSGKQLRWASNQVTGIARPAATSSLLATWLAADAEQPILLAALWQQLQPSAQGHHS